MTLPDSDTLGSYIGATRLINFTEPEDPNTDIGADGANQLLSSVAMASRMVARAVVAFDALEDGYVVDHEAVWGRSAAVTPTMEKVSTGVYNIAWPETVDDELGVEHSVNLRFVSSIVFESGSFRLAQGTITAANACQIRIANTSGTLTDPNQVVIVTVI